MPDQMVQDGATITSLFLNIYFLLVKMSPPNRDSPVLHPKGILPQGAMTAMTAR